MTKETYCLLENYMLSCMEDSAHDREHVCRVLYQALQIAETEPGVDYDVLIAACLLHDIGRKDQFADPNVCHAQAGSERAYRFLMEQGFPSPFAERVRDCILAHRFRRNAPPQTLEAKILFDADKLDVTGALGIARTLMYQGNMARPLYHILTDGSISDGKTDAEPSFFQEYHFKLKKLYDRFYTEKGRQLALQRRQAARIFYESLYREIHDGYQSGKQLLDARIEAD